MFGHLLDRLEELLPDAQRLTVEGASHLVQEDRPERFHEAVDVFLERHDASGAWCISRMINNSNS